MYENEYLAHYGVKGMRWGIRRFRNADGSLTNAGKKRLEKNKEKDSKKTNGDGRIYSNKIIDKHLTSKADKELRKYRNPDGSLTKAGKKKVAEAKILDSKMRKTGERVIYSKRLDKLMKTSAVVAATKNNNDLFRQQAQQAINNHMENTQQMMRMNDDLFRQQTQQAIYNNTFGLGF